jgi:Flp pilus assembly pilin Flp
MSDDGNRVAISGSYAAGVYDWIDGRWNQLGGGIDEEVLYSDRIIIAMTGDGKRVAIGDPLNDENGYRSGKVRVYDWIENDNKWTQRGEDIDGEAANDQSGRRVAMSADGKRVAIGANQNADGNGYNSGHVRVYDWIDNKWTQLGEDIDGEAVGDRYGLSVAMSDDGNRVAIGGENACGVYDWIDSKWNQLGGGIDQEVLYSGMIIIAMTADGKRVAIGAPEDAVVRVYEARVSPSTSTSTSPIDAPSTSLSTVPSPLPSSQPAQPSAVPSQQPSGVPSGAASADEVKEVVSNLHEMTATTAVSRQ